MAAVSAEATAEVYQLRALLEPYAAEIAVGKLTAHQLDELEALHGQLTSAARKDSLSLSDHNRAWHWALYQSADSPILNDLIRRLWDAFPWRTMWAVSGRTELTLQEHDAIMKAIRVRDAKQTSSLMREHIVSGRSTLLSQLEHSASLERETAVAAS